MDVWFDSGTTHLSVLQRHPHLRFPADLYLEGSDQHRGWFQSSLKTSVAINGCAPYRQVLTHGFTVDAEGRKMSKSVGNVVQPQAVVGRLGADVLRLWVAATDFSAEMSCSDEILKRTADAYRRIRNTCRYLLGNLHDFNPATDSLEPSQMLAMDAWLVRRCAQVQEQLRGHYQACRLHRAYQCLHRFCITDLGNFYLDVIKDRAYTCKADSLARRSAQSAMYLAAESLTRWMAPILSFSADEVWQLLPGERDPSVLMAQYLDLPAASDALEQHWPQLLELRERVNMALEEARNEGTIGGALDALVRIKAAPDKVLELVQGELHFLMLVSAVELETVQGLAEPQIEVVRASGGKCARCWHINASVGGDSEHPELCQRCVSNVSGDGEQRRFF